jgi:signal transduction histidine kinase
MTVIDFPELPDHDQISERVRIELGQRLTRLLDRFEMFLEDDPRDFSPGQIANYLTAAKMLGGLYQTFQRPVDKSGSIPADKVEKLLEAARMQAALEAVEAERARIAHERRMALESAGSGVRTALQRERDRQLRNS